MESLKLRDKTRRITAKIVPMPADTITDSIISAGWLLSQMDLAGGTRACKYVGGRAVTVGLDAMEFKTPVFIGDDVTIYSEICKQGRSSLVIKIEVYAESREGTRQRKVTEGLFTFVHIDEQGIPQTIDEQTEKKAKKSGRSRASITDVQNHEPTLSDSQELSLRVLPLPRDKNQNGDIFGGWLLTQMDIAGSVRARKYIGGTAVPVAIKAMTFHRPVSELSEVSVYTEIEKTGTTSVTIKVEAWALKRHSFTYEKVTEGIFVYVSVDNSRNPIPIKSKI